MPVGIGHETACKLTHSEPALGSVLAVDLCLVLYHTRVGGHVGEEHQGQTAGEEACAAAQLQCLVAQNIPVEAHTG